MSRLLVGLVLLSFGCNGDIAVTKHPVDSDNDGFDTEVDCDDAHAVVNPDALEICDGMDNDCDGETDVNPTDGDTFFADADADGHGDAATAMAACELPEGYVATSDDCDDAEADAFPGNLEHCDGIDNDCNGFIDDDASDMTAWYADGDGDGYGDAALTVDACDQPDGYVAEATDCDDTVDAIHPDAPETDCTDPVDYNCDGSSGYTDADGDGYAACDDCDDGTAARNPGAAEICDDADTDEDCDGLVDDDDDSVTSVPTWYRDADGDGYSAGTGTSLTQCETPTGYASASGDCDPYDPLVNPGATEICDASDTDEDCDGLADDDDPSTDAASWVTYYRDADSDAYGNAAVSVSQCEAPARYVTNDDDCDDADAARNPGEAEVCDAADLDEDCDTLADEADPSVTGATTWYVDADGDGYGDPGTTQVSCDQPAGYVATATDCDDASAAAHPGATEICDASNVDEDCDGLADDADTGATGRTTWHPDSDADGYGSTTSSTTACDQPAGYVASATDCNDAASTVNPAATEICDAANVDEDCDGHADDTDTSVSGRTTWYRDADSDSYGTSGTTSTACDQPSGYVATATDCNDAAATISPAAAEICDAADVDEDCDGLADDADGSVTGTTTWYVDADSDTYGTTTSTRTACSQPSGYAALSTDCNDASGTIHPGATEVCDAADTDEDCDGTVDDADTSVSGRTTWYRDADSDTYGLTTSTSVSCDRPSGYVATSGDCNDASSSISPAATEICDTSNTDEDCDGLADDLDSAATGRFTWHRDADSDTYGSSTTTSSACDQPSGYVANATDCNDASSSISPAAAEVCDAYDVDEDCDSTADDYDTSVTGTTTWYLDSDSDNYGVTTTTRSACSRPSGYAALSTDCNDASSAINPGATEVCDASDVDEDCDGTADDADTSVSGRSTWYRDADSDSYGLTTSTSTACDRPSGYVATSGDCNDTSSSISPAATEVCDTSNVDEDCDSLADDLDSAATGRTAWYRDADSDGYGLSTSSLTRCDQPSGYVSDLTDCNDGSAAISPADPEICDAANTDEDCDGLADDLDSSATGKTTWYVDSDADGYGTTSTTTSACDAPSGYASTSTDCNDSSSSVSPGATELCSTSSVDDDCSGTLNDRNATGCTTYYTDADADGYGTGSGQCYCTAYSTYTASVATDCLDTSASAHPGGTEVCGDGVDQDCSGTDETCASASWAPSGNYDLDWMAARYLGETASDYTGNYVAGGSDFNGDGYDDVVIGSCGDDYYYSGTSYYSNSGSVSVAYGGPQGATALSVTNPIVYFGSGSSYALCRVAADGADLNNDGTPDIIAGAPGYSSSKGEVFVISGAATTDGYAATYARSTITGATSSDNFGSAVAYAGDVDDDGSGDLLVGAYGYSSSTGRAYLFAGPITSGSQTYSTAAATFTGGTASDYAGRAVDGNGDIDGDGYSDIIIGAYGQDTGGTDAGAAYVYYGPVTGSHTLSSTNADAFFTGEAAGDYAGISVAIAGDVDGDGLDDVMIGATGNDDGGSNAGKAYVVFAPLATGRTSLSLADIQYVGEAASDAAGTSVDAAGDVDDDGYGDVLIGAPGYSSYTGRAYLGYGPGSAGIYDLSAVEASFTGPTTSDYAGISVAGIGDYDADGYPDMFVGADYAATGGAAYVVPGNLDNLLVESYDSLIAPEAAEYLGASVGPAGDFNHDGYDDVIVGATSGHSAYGAAYLFLGPISATELTSAPDGEFYGEASSDGTGFAVGGGGYVNADLYADVVIGAPYNNSGGADSGEIYLISGRATPTSYAVSSATSSMYGEVAGDYLGYAVSMAGDVDGSGYDDLLAGAPYNDDSGANAGKAYIIESPITTSAMIDTVADAMLTGEHAGDLAGYSVGNAGDVDGDGYDDEIVGAPYYGPTTAEQGAAYLVLGRTTGTVSLSTSDAIFHGESAYDHAGSGVDGAGDVDGDGYDDLLIGAFGDDDGGSSAGKAYLVLGPVTGTMSLSLADGYIIGEQAGDYLGQHVSNAGDIDDDGFDDFLASGYYADLAGSNSGTTMLVHGPVSGLARPFYFYGADAGDYGGSAIAGVGDTNYDGIDDFMIGAYTCNDTMSSGGRAYLFLGE
jgi:hypothetical protein